MSKLINNKRLSSGLHIARTSPLLLADPAEEIFN